MIKEFGDNCTIHLFEPNKMLLDYSRIKYEYKKNIVYNEVALSNRTGLANFFYFENFNNELSSLHKQDWWETELPMKTSIVKLCTVDNYCQKNKIEFIDYLKIDCEGNDYFVLIGAMEILKQDKIKFIQIEYGGHYRIVDVKFADIIKQMNELGYKVYSFQTDNYNEITLENFTEDYHYENYIITKEEIHNYSMDGGWLAAFRESVQGLPKFNFILEVGSYEGLTAKYMCQNMLEDDGRMIVVDPLKDYYTKEDDNNAYPYFKHQYQRWLRNTKGLPIELFRDDSRTVLPKFHAFRFDFIFIDGNHEGEVVYRDSVNCLPILKEGGYILWDDYDTYTKDTKAGIDRFLNEYENQYIVIKKEYQLLIRKN
jgi:FkbM family methyltransferase